MPLSHIFGVDASLTNTAIVAVSLHDFRRKSLSQSIRVCKVETSPRADLADRLRQIATTAESFFRSVRLDPQFHESAVAFEGFSFADRYRQYDLGAVQGVLRVSVRTTLGVLVSSITPGNAKAFICPEWPGFSKANWAAAGRRGPWKRSMPGKADVAHALFARYRFDPADEHVVDATLVALTHARAQGVLPHGPPPVPTPVRPLRSRSPVLRVAVAEAQARSQSRPQSRGR